MKTFIVMANIIAAINTKQHAGTLVQTMRNSNKKHLLFVLLVQMPNLQAIIHIINCYGFIQSPCLHNSWRDGTRMQQNKQKTGRKNSWKTQGAVCICHIMYIRTKLRFALLRSTLAAIWGFRSKRSDVRLQDLKDIDFILISRLTVTVTYSWTTVSMTWHQLHLWNKWVVYIDKLWLFVKLHLRTK